MERRLAAILAADMVGYSRLMGADEEGTIARQRAHREALIDPEIAGHGGRIVKTMGDGLLVEFPSVVDAVKCAVAVQRGMADREAEVPDERRIQYRVGINLGDIVIDGDDILGDGVNVAARLEGLAEPGGICISDVVHQSIEGKLDLALADMGAQQVKNIARPVRAYRVLLYGAPDPSIDEPLPLPDKPSIAVLPFDNLSGDPEQEYFSDGISEDIISALSKFRSFFVIARNSTFTYKGQAVDVTRVGKELGVRYVLEGSVRKAGDRLRTSAQLVDAQSGNHVWAERYDGRVADIFDLQDEITAQIVGALVPELDAAERARALRRPPEDVDTWVIFQRAMAHADRFNAEDNAQATTLLKETIEHDPGFVPAHAHLAVLRAQAARHGYVSDPSAVLDEAREYGMHAVSQDPNDAVAHLGLGIAAMFRGEGDVAIPEIEAAIDLNPNFARAYVWLGFAYSWCRGGMPETEIQYYDTALRLSPRDPWRWYCLMHKGSALRVLGQHEEAVAFCQEACRFPETGFLPLLHLTIALVHAGRINESRDVAAELLQKRPELTITIFKRMLSTLCSITLEPVLFALREAGLPEGGEVEGQPPPLPDKQSIAVLPFDNLSGDPEQEYFSDGMAEDLITDLSKISNLSVAARNSSFSFKGQMPDIANVVDKLGVAFVLEGSVRKMGDRLRINAQLIDGADGRHIWAERYDGDMAEIFEFQDNIREQIVAALQVSLTPTDKALVERKPTDSVEAYDLFLKGRANFYSATQQHTLEAIKCLEEALEIDPNFADAYGYLSFCHFYGWFHMWPEFDETLDRAYELAERGVALDSASAIAVMRLGFTQAWLRRFDQAIPNFNKAIALAPNNAEIYATFGQMLNYWGSPERGMEMIEKALSLETFAPPLWEFYLGSSFLLLHRYDEALTRFNRMAERAPKFAPAHFSLAWTYVELGRFDDAHDAIEAALGISSQYTLKEVDRLYPYRIDEVRNRFLDSLRKAGLPEGAEAEDEAPPLPDKPSIAVLPFENLSDDPQQEYFSDGMAEDLITDISNISGLFVIARNSSFAFKGQTVDVKEIASQLGVKHILEGSVRKMGPKLRVNAQLVDAESGGHLWAQRYDGDMADIFEFQDDIQAQIVSALQVSLTPTEKALTERKPTDNAEAYDLLLKGRADLFDFGPRHLLEAVKNFEKAIEIDPNFSEAYGYLSWCYFVGWVHMRTGFDDGLNRAHELAERGVTLDGASAIALAALGWVQRYFDRSDQAVANLEKAIALAPNNAQVYAAFGQVLNWLGNPERGLEMLEKAFSIDTLAPPNWEFYAGCSHLLLRQYDKALSRINRGIERGPKFIPAYPLLAWTYVEMGRLDDARDAIKTFLDLAPQFTVKKASERWPYRIDEDHNRFLDALRKAGLPEG